MISFNYLVFHNDQLTTPRQTRYIMSTVHEPKTNRADLERELDRLKAELAEREAALPAHSVRPHQLQAVMDLEERIEDLKRQLAAAED